MELPGFRAGSAIERRCQQPWREVRLAAQHFVNFVPAGKRRLTSGTTDADGGGRAGERQCIERRTLLDHPGGEGAGKGVAGDAVIAGIDDKTPYVQRAITQVYEDWLIQAGGSHFNAALTRPTNDTPEGFAALSQHVRHGLVTRVMPAEGVDSGVPNLHAFCAGRVATQQLWPGDLANCEAWTPDVFADILVGEPFRGPAKQGLQLFVD